MVPLHRALHGVEQLGATLVVAARLLVFVQRDAGAVGQEAHGVDEVEVVHGPHEADGVARLLAAEAVVHPVLGVDAEGRRLLGVEGAQPAPAPAHLLEQGVLADERHDVGGRPDLGDLLVRYPHTRNGTAAPAPGPQAGLASADGSHDLRRLRPHLHDGHVRPRRRAGAASSWPLPWAVPSRAPTASSRAPGPSAWSRAIWTLIALRRWQQAGGASRATRALSPWPSWDRPRPGPARPGRPPGGPPAPGRASSSRSRARRRRRGRWRRDRRRARRRRRP